MNTKKHINEFHTDLRFLYELLSEISILENQKPRYQLCPPLSLEIKNCQNPNFALQYVTTLSIVLKELTTVSTIQPNSQQSFAFWQKTSRLESTQFSNSIDKIKNWNLCLKTLWSLALNQIEREKIIFSNQHFTKQIDFYTEAYSKMVAIIFENGARLLNKSLLVVYNLGYYFGKLIYLLKTYQQHITGKQITIFHTIFDSPTNLLDKKQKQLLHQYLQKVKTKVNYFVNQIGLPKEKTLHFTNYLEKWMQTLAFSPLTNQ